MSRRRPRHTLRQLHVVVLAAVLLAAASPAFAGGLSPANPSVVVDPGHGGVYPGAVYGGVREADLNLAISRQVASELKRRSIGVTLVRNGDVTLRPRASIATWRWHDASGTYRYMDWGGTDSTSLLQRDLQARVNIGNKSGADVFVSIHNNAAGSSALGAETYSAPNDPIARQLARDVQTGVIARTGARDRGIHTARFYVLRWSNQPAVLVECGFMSNLAELARLRNPDYQRRIAVGIVDGLETFFRREAPQDVTRYWGGDRYDTAAALVKAGYESAETVVLSSGEVYTDSLVAAPLAIAREAPILITPGASLHPRTEAEIRRLRPGKILVVGGTNTIADEVVSKAAEAAGLNPSDTNVVRRIAGPDRYSTSLAVAQELDAPAERGVVVASGLVFTDALSVAASAASEGQPILLSADTSLSAGVRAYIENGGSQRPVTVVGGPKSVPDGVLAGLSFSRIGGADRYEANWNVFMSRYGAQDRSRPVFVSGTTFPDALVAGPWAAREGRPLVLVGGTALSAEFRPWYYSNHSQVVDPVIVGGPASVSAYLGAMLEKMKME